jgi:hypothetical protein
MKNQTNKKAENREVGKGEKWRKGTDFKTYRDNYDAIFRKKKKTKNED